MTTYQLNLSDAELSVLKIILAQHHDDEPDEYYDTATFDNLAFRVESGDLIVIDE